MLLQAVITRSIDVVLSAALTYEKEKESLVQCSLTFM